MPVGVQYPISSLLGEFPSYWYWLWCPGISPVLVTISLFPSPSILGVLHSPLSAIGFQSCFFFTADVSPPIRSTLHLLTFYVSFQACRRLQQDKYSNPEPAEVKNDHVIKNRLRCQKRSCDQ